MNFYASVAKGYKGPAANTSAAQPAGEDILLDPEKATAFEIGAKMRLFDNRLSVNAALFHEVIKGIQATKLDPRSPVIVTRFLNAGQLQTRGFECEAIWSVANPEARSVGNESVHKV